MEDCWWAEHKRCAERWLAFETTQMTGRLKGGASAARHTERIRHASSHSRGEWRSPSSCVAATSWRSRSRSGAYGVKRGAVAKDRVPPAAGAPRRIWSDTRHLPSFTRRAVAVKPCQSIFMGSHFTTGMPRRKERRPRSVPRFPTKK